MRHAVNMLTLLAAGHGFNLDESGSEFHDPADVRGWDDDDEVIGLEDLFEEDDEEVAALISGYDDGDIELGSSLAQKLSEKQAYLARLQKAKGRVKSAKAKRALDARIAATQRTISAMRKALARQGGAGTTKSPPRRPTGVVRPPTRPGPPAGAFNKQNGADVDVETVVDPSGGYTPFPFLPEAAPAGEWAGAVNSPRLTCTLAGTESASIDLLTRSMPYLEWQLISLRIDFGQAAAGSGLGGFLATEATIDGDTNIFAAKGRTDLSPWFNATEQNPPGLRYNGILGGTMRAQMSIVGVGVAADVLVITASALGWIVRDTRRKTAPQLVPKGPFPGRW